MMATTILWRIIQVHLACLCQWRVLRSRTGLYSAA
jgi:hypothetical protein